MAHSTPIPPPLIPLKSFLLSGGENRGKQEPSDARDQGWLLESPQVTMKEDR